MRAVVQRVTQASVEVEGAEVARIGVGLLVLVAVTHTDDARNAIALAHKIAWLRILRDGAREDVSAASISAAALVVSQFTLYADTSSGRRPSWHAAATRAVAQPLVDQVARELAARGLRVQTGLFGAMMRVSSVNDGPVTILLEE